MKSTVKIGCIAILMSMLFACSTMRPMDQVIPATSVVVRSDTIIRVSDRIITDTLILGSETITVHDTVPCPAGLTHDSLIFITKTVYKPGLKYPYTVMVHDTIRTVQTAPVGLDEILSNKYSWAERALWLLVLLAAVLAGLRKRKQSSQPVIS